jgi:hypothetical protein
VVELMKDTEEVVESGYVITIKEVWTKDSRRGYWIAQDTGGLTVRAETPELAVEELRKMFWHENLKTANQNRNA